MNHSRVRVIYQASIQLLFKERVQRLIILINFKRGLVFLIRGFGIAIVSIVGVWRVIDAFEIRCPITMANLFVRRLSILSQDIFL